MVDEVVLLGSEECTGGQSSLTIEVTADSDGQIKILR